MDSVRIYLDHNASSPLCAPARAAMRQVIDGGGGNPSSIHREGRRARGVVERARSEVAALLAADAGEIVFCSSGTEAVALAVIGAARARRAGGAPARLLFAATEHPAVLGAIAALEREGFAAKPLRVDREGVLDLDSARAALLGGAAVVVISAANHEVGTLQPIAALGALAAAAGASLVIDAVQAAGRIDIDPRAAGASAVAISAHKIYGPRGAGAVWIDPGLELEPVIGGGHQERERRPGTENVAGIAGTGAAAAMALERLAADRAHAAALIARLEEGLRERPAIGAEVVGAGAARIANTSCLRFAGAPAEVVVQGLDLAGFAVSAGAACTSGRLEPSPVLLAMGYSPVAATEAVRVSVGRDNSEADIDRLIAALEPVVARARQFG